MPEKRKKKPYVAPQTRTDKLFERKALACGKSTPTSQSCLANPKRS